MTIPDFIENPDPSSLHGRNLLRLSEIDVGRDIMDIEVILRADLDGYDNLNFTLYIESWQPQKMEVRMNFSDP